MTTFVAKPFSNFLLIMKKLFLFLILFSATVSCLKDDSGRVEQYIALLKSGNFNLHREMPIFEISDIPKLLKHVRNETHISIVVTPPYSSVMLEKLVTTIGMMALWTIEDTRLDADLPSASPVVKNSSGQNVAQKEVAGLYEKWWEKNKGKSVARLKEISPFERTDYSWH